jgi:SAM-dependent methyltransferase
MTPLCLGHATALRLLADTCPPPATIVDAGAYPGTLTKALARKGWRTIALDTAPDRDLTLQAKFNNRESIDYTALTETSFAEDMRAAGVTTYGVDLESGTFPFEDASIDGVVMTEVIEHLWVNPLHALAETNRILKPKGVLVISTPNLLSLRNRLNMLRGRMAPVIEHPAMAYVKKVQLGHVGHVRLYAADELVGLLRLMGFDASVSFHGFHYWEDGAPASASPAATAPIDGPPAQTHRPRWLKTPRELVAAASATSLALVERLRPSFRGHLFIASRKRESVDLSAMTLAAVDRQLTGGHGSSQ